MNKLEITPEPYHRHITSIHPMPAPRSRHWVKLECGHVLVVSGNPHNGHNSMLLCAKCRNLKIDWLSREARAEKRGGAMKVLEKRKPHISPRLRQLIETYCGMSAEQFVDLIVRRQRPTFNIHEFIDPRKRTMPVCRRRTNSTSRPSRSSRPCSSRLATKPIRWEWRSSRAPIRCTTARDYVLLDDGGILATARIDDDAGAGYFVALDSRGHIYAPSIFIGPHPEPVTWSTSSAKTGSVVPKPIMGRGL